MSSSYPVPPAEAATARWAQPVTHVIDIPGTGVMPGHQVINLQQPPQQPESCLSDIINKISVLTLDLSSDQVKGGLEGKNCKILRGSALGLAAIGITTSRLGSAVGGFFSWLPGLGIAGLYGTAEVLSCCTLTDQIKRRYRVEGTDIFLGCIGVSAGLGMSLVAAPSVALRNIALGEHWTEGQLRLFASNTFTGSFMGIIPIAFFGR